MAGTDPFDLSASWNRRSRCSAQDDCGFGRGAEPNERERRSSFRLRFSASSCFRFFFTEGFS